MKCSGCQKVLTDYREDGSLHFQAPLCTDCRGQDSTTWFTYNPYYSTTGKNVKYVFASRDKCVRCGVNSVQNSAGLCTDCSSGSCLSTPKVYCGMCGQEMLPIAHQRTGSTVAWGCKGCL